MKKSSSKSRKQPSKAADQKILDNGSQVEIINGRYLRKEREALGYTQEQMADIFRVTMNTYSRWERDHFLPNAPGAIQLAFEYLKIKRSIDDSALLRSLEQRKADIEAMCEQLEQEREEFERSIKK